MSLIAEANVANLPIIQDLVSWNFKLLIETDRPSQNAHDHDRPPDMILTFKNIYISLRVRLRAVWSLCIH